MIAVGVDTHKHQHIAVALDGLGQLLGEIAVAATVAGYRELVFWLAGLGGETVVGIEGTGSYGAGLCRHLETVGVSVVEVERPRRRDRRQGKSDRLDALLAAKRVRDRPTASPHEATILMVLRDLARRACQLDDQAGRYRNEITRLVGELSPGLPARIGASETPAASAVSRNERGRPY